MRSNKIYNSPWAQAIYLQSSDIISVSGTQSEGLTPEEEGNGGINNVFTY